MEAQATVLTAASGITEDRRWRMVSRTMRLHGYEPAALIEDVAYGSRALWIPGPRRVEGRWARELRVPLSRVYGVATFYHHFTLKPPGDHTCVVCKGTACYIAGASEILKAIEEQVGIIPGETTTDGKMSLVTARCLGSCGLAPAVVLDGEVCGRMNSAAVLQRIGEWDEPWL